MTINIEDGLPIVKQNGLNSAKDGTLSGAITFSGATTFSTGITQSAGDFTVTAGNVVISTASKGISWTATGTSGGLLTNLYNDTATTLTGTQRDIKILIGTVPYYFTVYPTKA